VTPAGTDPKGFWHHLLEMLGAPPPGTTVCVSLGAIVRYMELNGFPTSAAAVQVALDIIDDDFPFALRQGPMLEFVRKA
jgi:hypothetical protein